MIQERVAGQEAVARTARSIFPVVEKSNDEVTTAFTVHEPPRRACRPDPS
jgi:DNA-binding ferritin-like protein